MYRLTSTLNGVILLTLRERTLQDSYYSFEGLQFRDGRGGCLNDKLSTGYPQSKKLSTVCPQSYPQPPVTTGVAKEPHYSKNTGPYRLGI
jgi:hypothetical protein